MLNSNKNNIIFYDVLMWNNRFWVLCLEIGNIYIRQRLFVYFQYISKNIAWFYSIRKNWDAPIIFFFFFFQSKMDSIVKGHNFPPTRFEEIILQPLRVN